MRIVYMGTPDFALLPLEALLNEGYEVAGVYTQPDKPQGRKMVLTPPPVKALALSRGIPVFQPESFRGEAQKALLEELNPDLIVVVAYGKLLPQYVLDLPRYGCINVHGSLLPRLRGAAPIQWSVINGDKTAGVTTMQMNAGLDTGDMLLKYETPVGERETAGELYNRLAAAGADLLTETIRLMEQGELTPQKQDDALSTYAPMLDKKIAVIDWSRSAREIDCLIRGLNPWPVALTTLQGQRIKIYTARPVQGEGTPGAVLQADKKEGLIVACGQGALQLLEIQMVGGKRMDAQTYLHGHSIEKGTILGA